MMDKTININIAGTLFQIDEEAFRILRDYLQAINNRFRNVQGGLETIEDIELRIAEIFQSQKGLAGVITKENVEAMISIIGKLEDFDHIEGEADSPVYTTQRKRMYRNPDDSIISGVCGGIGAYLNIDPVLFRILFILFALFFGVGFFVYIALWIALPSANTNAQKREMYGNAYHSARSQNRQPDGTCTTGAPLYTTGYNNTSKVGNAFNEVFRAIGRVLYIIVRIFLIIIGITLVLTGFLALLTFVMVFVFEYPGSFSTDAFGMNLSYLPDFMNYIVTPSLVPWITAMILLVVTLPLLAFIYCGLKMIFWFRARDGVFLLSGLVLWVLSAAALSMILFNEGISFAETAKSTSQNYFKETPDTLYLISGRKISDLQIDKEISLPDEDYNVFISDEKKEIYIRTYLNIVSDEDNSARLNVKKRSAGRSRLDAMEKAERLQYNFLISGDTLFLDEFFTIPANTKWSFDNVEITVYAPEGTIIYMDRTTESQFHSFDDENFVIDSINRFWILKKDGLSYIEPHHGTRQ